MRERQKTILRIVLAIGFGIWLLYSGELSGPSGEITLTENPIRFGLVIATLLIVIFFALKELFRKPTKNDADN